MEEKKRSANPPSKEAMEGKTIDKEAGEEQQAKRQRPAAPPAAAAAAASPVPPPSRPSLAPSAPAAAAPAAAAPATAAAAATATAAPLTAPRASGQGKGKAPASTTPATAAPSASASASSSFNRCDPLVSCGIALYEVSRLESWRRPLFKDCNSSLECGARFSDIVPEGPPLNALVSTHKVDLPWLFENVPALASTTRRLAIVMGSIQPIGVDGTVAETRASLSSRRLASYWDCESTTVMRPPDNGGFYVHNSKFILLQYIWGVFMVVATGDFTPNAYTCKTQAVWFQSFPKRGPQSPPSSEFGNDLHLYLSELQSSVADGGDADEHSAGALEAMLGAVSGTDFSSARVDLVMSVPGSREGQAAGRFGSRALGRVLSSKREFSDSLVGCSSLVAQCSSLGLMTDAARCATLFRTWIAAASRGFSRSGAPLGLPAAAGQESDAGTPSPLPLSLVWPTMGQVASSHEGPVGGGSSLWGRPVTLRLRAIHDRLCRWGFGGGGVGGGGGGPGTTPLQSRAWAMPQMNSYFRFEPESKQVAWFVMGSSSFTEAAWGQEPEEGNGEVEVRNWELNVLLSGETEAAYRRHEHRGFNGAAATAATAAAAAASDAAPSPPRSLLFAAGSTDAAKAGPLLPGNRVEFYAAGQQARVQTTEARASAAGPSSSSAAAPAAAAAKDRTEIVFLPIPYPLPPTRYLEGEQPFTKN